MPNRTQVDPEHAAAQQQRLAALQSAAAAESQRHAVARVDDLTRRAIELHTEVILRDHEIAALKARVVELETTAKPAAKKAAAKKTTVRP